MPATPASSTRRRASTTPARSPGRWPGRSLTVTGRPEPSAAALAIATALSGSSSSAAPAPVLQTLRTGQPMLRSIRSAPAPGHDLGRLAHHVGVVAEELHRDGVLVGVDAQELADGALVAVLETEARHHLGHHEPGAVALGLQAHEPVADAGQRGEHQAVRQLVTAERPGVGELAHGHIVTEGGAQLRLRSQMMRRPWSVSRSSTSSICSQWGTIAAAKPPVAIAVASSSSSSRSRPTSPSTWPA